MIGSDLTRPDFVDALVSRAHNQWLAYAKET